MFGHTSNRIVTNKYEYEHTGRNGVIGGVWMASNSLELECIARPSYLSKQNGHCLICLSGQGFRHDHDLCDPCASRHRPVYFPFGRFLCDRHCSMVVVPSSVQYQRTHPSVGCQSTDIRRDTATQIKTTKFKWKWIGILCWFFHVWAHRFHLNFDGNGQNVKQLKSTPKWSWNFMRLSSSLCALLTRPNTG